MGPGLTAGAFFVAPVRTAPAAPSMSLTVNPTEDAMKTDSNLVTSNAIGAKPEEAPTLTSAQVEALDRDGDGKAGGSLPKARAGEVMRKGAPPPERSATKQPADLVTVRITKAGHGLVHDGAGGAYSWQDEVALPYAVALAQEGNKNAEIIGD